MCTLIALYRPGHEWPVLIAANRDEMAGRTSRPPARHWADRRNVVAGLDELGGGSWFGLNDDGVAAGIMNRAGTLGPAAGKRSRGELVLEALDHADAEAAAQALSHINPAAYRGFNLIIADSVRMYWLRHDEAGTAGRVDVIPVAPGLSMFTAHDRNDVTSTRIRHYLPLAQAAPVPDPERGDWSGWRKILESRTAGAGDGSLAAMNVQTAEGFGTVSSLLLALPARERFETKPRFLFAAGRPDEAPFVPVPLD